MLLWPLVIYITTQEKVVLIGQPWVIGTRPEADALWLDIVSPTFILHHLPVLLLKIMGCVSPKLEMIPWCHLTFQSSTNFSCLGHSSARLTSEVEVSIGKAGGKVKPLDVLGTFELTSLGHSPHPSVSRSLLSCKTFTIDGIKDACH